MKLTPSRSPRCVSAAGNDATNNDARGSRDSFITFTATTAGTYYVGVSAAGNTAHNPRRGGSGRVGSPDAAAVMGDAFAAVSGTRQAPCNHGRVIP